MSIIESMLPHLSELHVMLIKLFLHDLFQDTQREGICLVEGNLLCMISEQ